MISSHRILDKLKGLEKEIAKGLEELASTSSATTGMIG